MVEGNPTSKKRNWLELEMPVDFKISIKRGQNFSSLRSCASAALSTITGIDETQIARHFRKPADQSKVWGLTTQQMRNFLETRGFLTTEISQADVINTDWSRFPINDRHLVLMNVRMDRQDNSAYVMHGGYLWHNYQKFATKKYPLFFLNKPTQDVVIVHLKPRHFSWQLAA